MKQKAEEMYSILISVINMIYKDKLSSHIGLGPIIKWSCDGGAQNYVESYHISFLFFFLA